MSMQRPAADDEPGLAGTEPPNRWIVWRQDDNGN
jgi:hypothetical protein